MTTAYALPGGLPDPYLYPEFYRDVPSKRFFAWVADIIVIALLTALLTVFSLFTALLILPFVFATLSFLYRWVTLASGSATLGMRLAGIEVRAPDGGRLSPLEGFLHTAGYFVSVAVFPLQLVSIALMLITARGQGLTDLVLGTAALNRRAA